MPSKTNLLLFTISTLLSLVLGELVLRWAAKHAATEGIEHHKLYCEYDPLLGWRKIANHTGHHKTSEYEVFETINSMGIRGPEYPLEKDSGEHRTVILGDSFSEGYTVNFEALFSEVMQDSLLRKFPGQRFEAINTGTGGWSTDQELLCFENLGVRFQPDLTVLMFCVNDPFYNNQPHYWRGFKPLFVQEGDSLKLTNVPVPTLASKSVFFKIKDWSLRNVEIAKALKRLKDKAARAVSDQKVPDEWLVYQKNTTPQTQADWDMTAALLKRLREKTEAAGSRLCMFYIPEKFEVHPDEWAKFLREYSLKENTFDATLPRRQLGGICKNLGIQFLDPTAVFVEKAEADTTKRFYFDKDGHWNANGHRLAGELLTELYVRDEG